MLIIFFRAIILFITLVIIMRLMGKRQIGEMQPFEFIITLLIAELACVPMADISIPLIYGVVSVLAVFILHQLLTIFEQSSKGFRKLINGKPAIVIDKNGVDLKELKKNNMSVDDLIESLRVTGNFSLDSVYYAIYESNGKLSVLPSNDNEGVKELPLIIIQEGKKDKANCLRLKLDESFFDEFLKNNGIKRLSDVEVMTAAGDGKVYLKTKKSAYKTVKINFREGVKW